MNPDGYIEMILDDKNDSSAISNSLEKAHDQVSSVATNCDVDSAQESETHLRFDPESANSDCKAQQHALPHHWETMTGVKNVGGPNFALLHASMQNGVFEPGSPISRTGVLSYFASVDP